MKKMLIMVTSLLVYNARAAGEDEISQKITLALKKVDQFAALQKKELEDFLDYIKVVKTEYLGIDSEGCGISRTDITCNLSDAEKESVQAVITKWVKQELDVYVAKFRFSGIPKDIKPLYGKLLNWLWISSYENTICCLMKELTEVKTSVGLFKDEERKKRLLTALSTWAAGNKKRHSCRFLVLCHQRYVK